MLMKNPQTEICFDDSFIYILPLLWKCFLFDGLKSRWHCHSFHHSHLAKLYSAISLTFMYTSTAYCWHSFCNNKKKSVWIFYKTTFDIWMVDYHGYPKLTTHKHTTQGSLNCRKPFSNSSLLQPHTCASLCLRAKLEGGWKTPHSLIDVHHRIHLFFLPQTGAHPLYYWGSGFICQVLTSVSRPFQTPSLHLSWLRVLQAAVQKSHLFYLLVEIALARNKRARPFYVSVTS